jgi:hypothetical protein
MISAVQTNVLPPSLRKSSVAKNIEVVEPIETSASIYQIARFHAKEDREMVRNYHYSLHNDL